MLLKSGYAIFDTLERDEDASSTLATSLREQPFKRWRGERETR